MQIGNFVAVRFDFLNNANFLFTFTLIFVKLEFNLSLPEIRKGINANYCYLPR
jgi:hypothetical protein